MMNQRIFIYGLLALLPALIILSLTIGASRIDVIQAIADITEQSESIDRIILTEVRLPRTLLALLVGAALGMSGAALQGLLRNPLASPGLLGISQSASLGAVITLYFGLSLGAWIILPAAAMLGALAAVVLIFLLAGNSPGTYSVILIGIALNAIMTALLALALNLAPNPYALQEIYFWLLGSVSNRSMQEVLFASPFILIGAALLWSTRHYLDALTLGEETAQSLGFNQKVYSWIVIVGVALCTGSAVSVSGNIAFAGLLVPHLLRPIAQYQPGKLLTLSALGGAIFLLLADLLVRSLPMDTELQLGVITSALGGPFFLGLIYHHRHRMKV